MHWPSANNKFSVCGGVLGFGVNRGHTLTYFYTNKETHDTENPLFLYRCNRSKTAGEADQASPHGCGHDIWMLWTRSYQASSDSWRHDIWPPWTRVIHTQKLIFSWWLMHRTYNTAQHLVYVINIMLWIKNQITKLRKGKIHCVWKF